jgi:hypothetical protein
MARSAVAVIRFMTLSPFHEASNSDRLQSVKRSPLGKRANIPKLFFEKASGRRKLMGASNHVCG